MHAGLRIFELRASALAIGLVVLVAAGCGSDDEDETTVAEPVAEKPAFGYGSSDGPDQWASLDPSYATCAEGKEQSPIALGSDAQPSELSPIEFDYEPVEIEIENNGHSLEALPAPGNSLEVDGTEYELDQFHFHAPSEHEIDGRPAPVEFHFVNLSDDGEPFVLGVLVEEGPANAAAAQLVKALPPEDGETLPVLGDVNPIDLLPRDPGSAPRWHYDGSLTTPPCTEGVDWNVYKEPIEMSAEQIAAYTSIYGDNRRPLQPLNDRRLAVSR